MLVRNWADTLVNSFMNVIDKIIGFIPDLIGAIVLLVIGLLVARALEFAIEKLITLVKLDSLLRKIGLDRYLQRAGIGLNSGRFLGKLAYWIILIVFAVGIADVLGLTTLSLFITSALGWVFTNLVAAILILLVAAFIAQFLKKLVNASVTGAKLHSIKFLGSVVWWIVMIFGGVAALKQLGVDTGLVESTLMSFIVAAPLAVGLAVGLAFGLGGKKQAEQILDRLEEKFDNR
ncbi:MAG: hypothetical protein WC565_01705 [Parcubacteria group bacterium]